MSSQMIFGFETMKCVNVFYATTQSIKNIFTCLQGVRMRDAIVAQQTLPPLHVLPSVLRHRKFDGRKDGASHRTRLIVTTAKKNH
jgi:hypothetical protein